MTNDTTRPPPGACVINAPVAKISVPENRLRELRDYEGLAESMQALGLLQPITVSEAGVLVSGRHRLEAAKSLGWESIPAFVVEDDALANRLIEIDENLKRLDLTVWEQAKHAEERERVLEALGLRRGEGRHPNPDTMSGLEKTTEDLAAEVGMTDRSWRRRTKIGREIGEQTAAVLDHADVTDEKQRNLLNSTTQLDHLANISRKRGDGVAAEVAERALSEEGGNVFKEYDKIKGVPELPPFELSEARKAYYRVSRYLVGLSRLDPEEVASECESEDAANKDAQDAAAVVEWFARYAQALAKRGTSLEPGNLRRVK